MTPKEKDVVRAVIKSLRSRKPEHHTNMISYALSYGIPLQAATVRGEMEALLLEALANDDNDHRRA